MKWEILNHKLWKMVLVVDRYIGYVVILKSHQVCQLFILMENIICSVLFIISVSSFVNCIPTANSGGGYKLEGNRLVNKVKFLEGILPNVYKNFTTENILSKNDPNSKPIASGTLADKIDLSPFYNTVVEHLVPTLLQKHQSGSPPGKETTHRLGTSITESLTKGLSDAFNSKLGQEFMIAAGIKKNPTLVENLYETIVTYIKWIGTTTSNKMHEVEHKGLIRTFSDTISDTFGSHGHSATTTPHGTYKPDTLNGKIPQHGTQTVMQTRDLLDHLNDSFGYRGHQSHRNHRSGPWNNFLYQPYNNRYNPYSRMGGGNGFFATIAYLISSVLFGIQDFFNGFFSRYRPPPPQGGRPSIIRRPPQSYY